MRRFVSRSLANRREPSATTRAPVIAQAAHVRLQASRARAASTSGPARGWAEGLRAFATVPTPRSQDSSPPSPPATPRLASVSLSPREEFPHDVSKLYMSWQVATRIFKLGFGRVFNPKANALLVGSIATLYGMGFVEGCLLCLEPWESVGFLSRYALENIPASCVWESVDAADVARAMGIDPKAILRDFQSDHIVRRCRR